MKLLIAYDGSECSDTELEDLQRAGLPQEAEVLVMSMADVFLPGSDENDNGHVPDAVKRARERAQQKLDEAKALAEGASERIQSLFPGWRVRADALADSPAWALIRTADEWKPDLIVMGARGQSFFGGRLSGPNARACGD